VIIFGSGPNEFELSLDHGALRSLVDLSTEALTKLDADGDQQHADESVSWVLTAPENNPYE
jgi:hypothetical protein